MTIDRKYYFCNHEYPVVVKADGTELIKANNQGVSSFFPNGWSKAKILDEVEYAIANNHGKIPEKPSGNEYFGYSRDGKVEIHLYYNTDGLLVHIFLKRDNKNEIYI